MARDKNETGGHSQWDLGSGKTRIQVTEITLCNSGGKQEGAHVQRDEETK